MNKEQMNVPNREDEDHVDHKRRDFLKKTVGYAGVAATVGIADLYAGEKKREPGAETQKMSIELIRDKFDTVLRDLVFLIDESQVDGDIKKLIVELRSDIGVYLNGDVLDSETLSEFGKNLNRIKFKKEQNKPLSELRTIQDIMIDIEAISVGLAPLGLLEEDKRREPLNQLKISANELRNVELKK